MTIGFSQALNAAKLISPSLIPKFLGKINPKFNNYFTQAASFGFGADQAINYLNQRFKSESEKQYEDELEKGEANQTLRPDEMASKNAMENRGIPGKALRAGASIAAGGLLAGGEQQSPQQSPHIPAQLGQLPDNLPNSQEGISPPNSPSPASFSDQFPQLFQAAQKGLTQGMSPEEVYQKLSSSNSYAGLVKKFEEMEGMSFLDRIHKMVEGIGSPSGNRTGQMGNAGKDQFLQGLSQMSEMLQKLKGR